MMTTEKSNVLPQDSLVRLEDFAWIKSVFNLIPRGVYGGTSSPALKEPETDKKAKSADGREKEKKKKPKKKQSKKLSAGDIAKDSSERAILKEELQQKISEKRIERKADDKDQIALRAHLKRKRQEQTAAKEKAAKKIRRDEKFEKIKKLKDAMTRNIGTGEENGDSKSDEDDGKEAGDNDMNVGLETTRLAGFNEEHKKKKVRRKKLSGGKLQELQLQLEKATEEQELKNTEKARSSKKGSAKGGKAGEGAAKVVVDREIEKALKRVQGEDVRDDVKRLKKSIRMEKWKGEKSKEEWAKRVESLDKEMAAKQERRNKKLKERKENKGKSGKGKGKGKPKKSINKHKK